MIPSLSKAAASVPPAPVAAARDHALALEDEQVTAAVQSFAMPADATRVRMLWALRDAHVRGLLSEALFPAGSISPVVAENS